MSAKVLSALWAAAILLINQSAWSEDANKLIYDVVRQADGSLKLVARKGNSEAPKVGEAESGLDKSVDPATWATVLKDQDWYVKKTAAGSTSAIYSLPAGQALPAEAISSLGTGESVTKVAVPTWVDKATLSQEQMRQVLEALINNAKAAVCGMSARPSQFGTQVDVSVGVGVSGTISFNATWETKELCGS